MERRWGGGQIPGHPHRMYLLARRRRSGLRGSAAPPTPPARPLAHIYFISQGSRGHCYKDQSLTWPSANAPPPLPSRSMAIRWLETDGGAGKPHATTFPFLLRSTDFWFWAPRLLGVYHQGCLPPPSGENGHLPAAPPPAEAPCFRVSLLAPLGNEAFCAQAALMRTWIDDDGGGARRANLASDLQRLTTRVFISIMNPQRLSDELLTSEKTTSSSPLPA